MYSPPTLGQGLDQLLFQLLAQGCLVTGGTGADDASREMNAQPQPRVWWWDPSTTSFAIELASTRLLRRLQSLQLLPRHHAEGTGVGWRLARLGVGFLSVFGVSFGVGFVWRRGGKEHVKSLKLTSLKLLLKGSNVMSY